MAEKHERIEESDDQDFENMKGEVFQSTCYQSCLECCGNLTGCLKIWCPCMCCCCNSPVYQIQTAKVGVHQSFGRFKKILKPGFHIINPISESVIEVDLKTSIFEMAPQQVITKDNVTMLIQTVVYYRAINPFKLVYKLRNNTAQIREFIKQISYSALRSVIGENIFQELLQHRAKLALQLENYVKEKVYPWGLFIENIFIKDVILSPQVQRNLQSAAIQKRISQATIISAKADVESAKLLKETSQILNSSSAMQIRYLEAIQNIVNKSATKTIFMSLKGKEIIANSMMEDWKKEVDHSDTATSDFYPQKNQEEKKTNSHTAKLESGNRSHIEGLEEQIARIKECLRTNRDWTKRLESKQDLKNYADETHEELVILHSKNQAELGLTRDHFQKDISHLERQLACFRKQWKETKDKNQVELIETVDDLKILKRDNETAISALVKDTSLQVKTKFAIFSKDLKQMKKMRNDRKNGIMQQIECLRGTIDDQIDQQRKKRSEYEQIVIKLLDKTCEQGERLLRRIC